MRAKITIELTMNDDIRGEGSGIVDVAHVGYWVKKQLPDLVWTGKDEDGHWRLAMTTSSRVSEST